MKSGLFLAVIITSFAALTTFSFLGMHAQNDTHINCIAVATGQTPCPKEINPLAFATFHISVFKGLSQLTINPALIFGLLALLILGLVVLFGELRATFESNVLLAAPVPQKLPGQQKFFQWLEFHENSPNLIQDAR